MRTQKIIGFVGMSLVCMVLGGLPVYAEPVSNDWITDGAEEFTVPPKPPMLTDGADYSVPFTFLMVEGWGYIYSEPVEALSGDTLVAPADSGAILKPIERMNEEWWKILYNGKEAYISSRYVKEQNTIKLSPSDEYRAGIVNYALQFIGNAYVYGGSNPETGIDCSGFTSHVLKQGAGIDITRTTKTQAQQGVEIDISQIRPGDLVFYGTDRDSINHVSLYIGDGKIMHAANEWTGVAVMPWESRSYWVKIVNVLGDK